MGVKKIHRPKSVMASTNLPVAVSGTSTYTSQAINIENVDNVGLQLIWTGTPTGTFTVLHSPDNVVYDAITLNPLITQPAGSAGHWSVVLQQDPYLWVKVQYVNASGSGTVDVITCAKDVN